MLNELLEFLITKSDGNFLTIFNNIVHANYIVSERIVYWDHTSINIYKYNYFNHILI